MIITGPNSVCSGNTIVLHADLGYDEYSWSPDGENTQSITVSPTTTTSYTVTGRIGGVSDTSTAHLVTVYPLPSPSIKYLVGTFGGVEVWEDAIGSQSIPDVGLLLRSDYGYASYQWYKDNSPITGATYRYYQAIEDGDYKVKVRSILGCENYSGICTVDMGDSPTCLMRLLDPVENSKNVSLRNNIVFDIRFNYKSSGSSPFPFPSTEEIRVTVMDGGIHILNFAGESTAPGNVTIYKPTAIFDSYSGDWIITDNPLGTDSGYRYVISNMLFGSGSTIKIDVVVR